MLLLFVGVGFQLPPPVNPDTRGRATGNDENRETGGTAVQLRSGGQGGDSGLSGSGSSDE